MTLISPEGDPVYAQTYKSATDPVAVAYPAQIYRGRIYSSAWARMHMNEPLWECIHEHVTTAEAELCARAEIRLRRHG